MLITYPLSRWFYQIVKRYNLHYWGMFFYLLTIASVGNFWDYVPIRIFATDGDMYKIAKGFDCSPWLVLLVLGIPTISALIYLFQKIQINTLLWLFPNSKWKRAVMIVLTSFGIFGFYGAAGWADGDGEVSKWLSVVSIFLLFPAMTLYSFWHMKKCLSFQQVGE